MPVDTDALAVAGRPAATDSAPSSDSPFERYRAVRARTEELCEPLATEDYVVQSMPDVSPTKWHLAHVTWFFETFLLKPHLPDYQPLDPLHSYLFNSYYVRAGERHCRDQRGYISRPTVSEVYDFRAHVDEHVEKLLGASGAETREELLPVLEIGLHHEQQHQELLLTDIKHVLSVNPLRPAYREGSGPPASTEAADDPAEDFRWIRFPEGLVEIGHAGEGFAYDNESPRHRHFLEEYLLADRPVTNGEYLAFLEDGGYERPELWLSEGWAAVGEREWTEPFYWEKRDGRWHTFTLGGLRELAPEEPVCHLTYFEAEAFARWAGARLPMEQEWEVAARELPIRGNLQESGPIHPAPPSTFAPSASSGDGAPEDGLRAMYGDVWEWTRSQYSPYPGFEPLQGALGEYNGKFMANQFVLRGGSCATPRSHLRPTYRNFFPPDAAWQFTGLRLARDG